jgi:hypothetical protein
MIRAAALSRVALSRVALMRVVLGQVISRVVMPGRVVLRPVVSTFTVASPSGPGHGAGMSRPGQALPACAALLIAGCADSPAALIRRLR